MENIIKQMEGESKEVVLALRQKIDDCISKHAKDVDKYNCEWVGRNFDCVMTEFKNHLIDSLQHDNSNAKQEP